MGAGRVDKKHGLQQACGKRIGARIRAHLAPCRGESVDLPVWRCAWTQLAGSRRFNEALTWEGCAEANGDGAEEAKPVE